MGDDRLLEVNGVSLCVETFGSSSDPALLLIGGASASMDWWDDDFCRRLATEGRHVVRYDHRDTGRSVSYPAGSPGYGFTDLATDAIGLLDALGVDRAHLVGISMGGFLAQLLALDHPGRVRSLVLMSTSPAGPGGPDNPDLPPISEELQASFASRSEPDWSDRAVAIEQLVDGERRCEGPDHFDEAQVRVLAGRVFDRTTDMAACMANHTVMDGGEPTRPRLADVTAPTLVVHGTLDPLFPPGHAEALAREIPGAHVLLLDGVGHQLPPRALWDTVIPAILRHTAGYNP